MNYLYIGILTIAAIVIIGLGIKLAITKADIKKKKELAAKSNELLARRDHEIMEDTAKILEKFPPANGPDPIKEPDYDNQYTSETCRKRLWNIVLLLQKRMNLRNFPKSSMK